jgi:hypothetical protein
MATIITANRLFKPVVTAEFGSWDQPCDFLDFAERHKIGGSGSVWERFDLEALWVASLPHRSYVGCDVSHWGGSNQDITACFSEPYLIAPKNIVVFIRGQLKGEPGLLTTSSNHASVMYALDRNGLPVCVSFRWNSGLQRWRLDVSNFEQDCGWLQGTRIIFPGTMAIIAS